MNGHIRRRGERSWELKFDLGADPFTGKRRIRYASFKGTKRDAEIEFGRLVLKTRRAKALIREGDRLRNFCDRWDRDWASRTSAKTFERYREMIALYVMPHLGAVRIQKLRPVHLTSYMQAVTRGRERWAAASAPRTVGHVHRLLHRALGHAATWGIIAQNVALSRQSAQVAETELTILNRRSDRGRATPS